MTENHFDVFCRPLCGNFFIGSEFMFGISRKHPLTVFLYYASVILITMFTMNPLILLLSLAFSLLYLMILKIRVSAGRMIIMFLLIAGINPLLSRYGETLLFTVGSVKYTLEPLLYGVSVAAMLVSAVFWFQSYQQIMTSDKFLFLFQHQAPRIALTISMGLRNIPLFFRQSEKIRQAQTGLGLFSKRGKTFRYQSYFRIFTSLFSWSLENGINTAEAMKARGYGLKGKTSLMQYRYRKQDILFLTALLLLSLPVILLLFMHRLDYSYYPVLSELTFHRDQTVGYLGTGILFLLPSFLEIKENLQWHSLQSKI
jgi:energy-coupling factor transport system permease protein